MKLKKQHIIKILFSLAMILSILCIVWIAIPCNRAKILWEKGYHDKAFSLWHKEILRRNDINSYQKIIEIYINSGMYNEAENFTKKALTYYPNCVNFYFYNAMLNFYKGNYNRSFSYTERVVEMNEYFPEVYLLRGMIMEKLKKYEQAKYEFIKELNNNPGNRLAWAKLKELKNANY